MHSQPSALQLVESICAKTQEYGVETDCVFIENKSGCKWIFTVQIHIVQWTTVLGSKSVSRPKENSASSAFFCNLWICWLVALFLNGNCEAILRHTKNNIMGSKTYGVTCASSVLCSGSPGTSMGVDHVWPLQMQARGLEDDESIRNRALVNNSGWPPPTSDWLQSSCELINEKTL